MRIDAFLLADADPPGAGVKLLLTKQEPPRRRRGGAQKSPIGFARREAGEVLRDPGRVGTGHRLYRSMTMLRMCAELERHGEELERYWGETPFVRPIPATLADG